MVIQVDGNWMKGFSNLSRMSINHSGCMGFCSLVLIMHLK